MYGPALLPCASKSAANCEMIGLACSMTANPCEMICAARTLMVSIALDPALVRFEVNSL